MATLNFFPTSTKSGLHLDVVYRNDDNEEFRSRIPAAKQMTGTIANEPIAIIPGKELKVSFRGVTRMARLYSSDKCQWWFCGVGEEATNLDADEFLGSLKK